MKGEWQRVKLGEVGRIITGKTPSTKVESFWNGDVPFVTPGDLQAGKHLFETARYVTALGMDAVKGSALPKHAICVSCIGNLGYVGMTTCACISNQQINSIVVGENSDADFVYYALKNLWPFFKHIEGQSTALSILNKSQFSKLDISLPPLPTQRRIAAVLGALDDKIELNRKMNANLEAQAQALFKSLPRFEETPFLSLIDLLSGGTPRTDNPEYWNGDIPFFSPKDVGNPFAISTERYVTTMGVENCNSACYPAYTTFITARGTVGKVCMAGVPMAMNQSCFALTSKDIHPLLVYFYALESVSSLKKKSNGAVFDAITIREFKTEVIRRAKIEDEKKFVAFVRTMYELMLKNIFESRKLAELRDALLPKLMSGELEVA